MRKLAFLAPIAASVALVGAGTEARAHSFPTCSHTTTIYSGYLSGFGYTKKAVHNGILGYLTGKHGHTRKHYSRTPSNPTWSYTHIEATYDCAGH